MVRTLKLMIISITFVCSTAVANPLVWDRDFSISDTKAITVTLEDDASGACWTNLKETREYAEEKVRMLGGKIDDFDLPLASERKYELYIYVHLSRQFVNDTGDCYGNVRISLRTYAIIDTVFHNAEIARYSAILLHQDNLNATIINAMSKFFSVFR